MTFEHFFLRKLPNVELKTTAVNTDARMAFVRAIMATISPQTIKTASLEIAECHDQHSVHQVSLKSQCC